MNTRPISETELDRLLDLAAKAPDYNHEKLADSIAAQAAQPAPAAEDSGYLLIAILQRPLLAAGIGFSIAALGVFTGISAEMLYGDLLTTSLIVDTPIDFHTSLLLI